MHYSAPPPPPPLGSSNRVGIQTGILHMLLIIYRMMWCRVCSKLRIRLSLPKLDCILHVLQCFHSHHQQTDGDICGAHWMQQFTQILLESSLSTLHHISLSGLCVPITSHSPSSSRNARLGLCHSPLFTPVLLHLLIVINSCPKATMTCFDEMWWWTGEKRDWGTISVLCYYFKVLLLLMHIHHQQGQLFTYQTCLELQCTILLTR